jgi:mono/diheme cytochrome c family protein
MKVPTTPREQLVVPTLFGLLVGPLALALLTIGARSPYTQSNLNAGYDAHYTRTEQSLVGSDVPYLPAGLAGAPSADLVTRGQELFVANDCAGCHGLDGHGGVIGPRITSIKASRLRSKTNSGPGAMPAFAPNALTDDDLHAIEAYLKSQSK